MILKKDGKSGPRIFINTLGLIFKHFFSLLLGQIIFIGILIFMLAPLLHLLYNNARILAGYSYITINNLVSFLLQPFTILILILSFLVVGLFLLLEAAFYITFYSIIENGNTPKIIRVLFLSMKRLILSILHRNFRLLPIIWLTVIVSNLPLIVFIVENVDVFRYATKFINKIQIIFPIFFVLFMIMFFILFRRLFVFQYCLYEGRNYKTACKLSRKIKKTKVIRTLCYIIGWNIGLGILIYLIHMIAVTAMAFLVICFTPKSLAVASFISINEKVSNSLAFIIFSISLSTNFALITHLFYQYKKEDNEYFYFDNSVETIFLKLRSYKTILVFFSAAFLILNFVLAYNIIRNDTPFVYVDFDMIKITSHRGFSKGVPENTLPAIEKAIEEKADYVEVDVRQTQDGELVLLHDQSLKRTTGISKYIWNVNYDKVAQLDAGSWFSKEYANTKIPSLRETFELCKGNINLNLDLKDDKYAGGKNYSPSLEDSVVALIDEFQMENQCVITSTSLNILENIKALNPKIKTGYITYQIRHSDYTNENIDFFSINSCFASENLLQNVHEEGKEILVWTVNSKSELERMKRLGVDNIITDNPSYARETLFEDNANRSFLTLLKVMMEY